MVFQGIGLRLTDSPWSRCRGHTTPTKAQPSKLILNRDNASRIVTRTGMVASPTRSPRSAPWAHPTSFSGQPPGAVLRVTDSPWPVWAPNLPATLPS